MNVLDELGHGMSLEVFPELDSRIEDWKYTRIPKDLKNCFANKVYLARSLNTTDLLFAKKRVSKQT